MKNKTVQTIKKTLLGILAAAALGGNAAQGHEAIRSPELKIDNVFTEVGYHSKYLGSYGFNISQTPVIQSSLGFSLNNLNFSAFSNYDPKKGVTEFDPSVSTQIETKYLAIKPELSMFTYPSVNETINSSMGLSLSAKNLPLDIKLFGVQAFGEGSYEGRLYQLSLGKSIKLSKRITASLGITGTYNDGYFVKGNGFSMVQGGINLGADLGKGYSINAGFRAQKALQTSRFGGCFKDDPGMYEISFRRNF